MIKLIISLSRGAIMSDHCNDFSDYNEFYGQSCQPSELLDCGRLVRQNMVGGHQRISHYVDKVNVIRPVAYK